MVYIAIVDPGLVNSRAKCLFTAVQELNSPMSPDQRQYCVSTRAPHEIPERAAKHIQVGRMLAHNTFLCITAQVFILPLVKIEILSQNGKPNQRTSERSLGLLENAIFGQRYFVKDDYHPETKLSADFCSKPSCDCEIHAATG